MQINSHLISYNVDSVLENCHWYHCNRLLIFLQEKSNMAEETIYLCNFRVSVDGDWLCLKELSDMQLEVEEGCLLSPETEDGKGHGREGVGGKTSV